VEHLPFLRLQQDAQGGRPVGDPITELASQRLGPPEEFPVGVVRGPEVGVQERKRGVLGVPLGGRPQVLVQGFRGVDVQRALRTKA
jgi:hypothetical protein